MHGRRKCLTTDAHIQHTSLLFHPKLSVRALTSELCWSNRRRRAKSFCSSTGICLTWEKETKTLRRVHNIDISTLGLAFDCTEFTTLENIAFLANFCHHVHKNNPRLWEFTLLTQDLVSELNSRFTILAISFEVCHQTHECKPRLWENRTWFYSSILPCCNKHHHMAGALKHKVLHLYCEPAFRVTTETEKFMPHSCTVAGRDTQPWHTNSWSILHITLVVQDKPQDQQREIQHLYLHPLTCTH